MAERGERRAERAKEYLNSAGRERIRRLREQVRQINEYLKARQARQLAAGRTRSGEFSCDTA
jgi:hypothetical protein